MEAYQKSGISYSEKLDVPHSPTLPASFDALSENYHFLNETENFWTCCLVVLVPTFALLYLVRRRTQSQRLKDILVKFACFSFLVLSLLSENIQFFSFRGFSQLYGRSLIGSQTVVFNLNLVISYTMVFVSLAYAVAAPWLFVWLNTSEISKAIYDDFRVARRTCLCLSVYMLSRFFTGAMHAMLYDQPELQIVLLTTVQVINIFIVYILRKQFRKKTHLAIRATENVLRIALHAILTFEVFFDHIKPETTTQLAQ